MKLRIKLEHFQDPSPTSVKRASAVISVRVRGPQRAAFARLGWE